MCARYILPHQIRKKRNERRTKKTFWSFLFLALIVGALAFLSRLDSLQIKEMIATDTQFIDRYALADLFQSEISGNYFGLFPKSSYILFSRNDLEKKIKEKFSSVEIVEVKGQGFHAASIQIQEYQPVAFWCSEGEKSKCYLMNKLGVIFANEPVAHSYILPRFYNVLSGEVLGLNYLNTDIFSSMLNILNGLPELGIDPVSVRTEDNSTFRIDTKQGLYLLIDIHDALDNALPNLKTIIEKDTLNKAQLGNLLYIDLRFGNKVFYKIK